MSAPKSSGSTLMVVSDTNILGSFAAADALSQLKVFLELHPIVIPPAVEKELQAGVVRGAAHLERVFDAIEQADISILPLDESDQAFALTLPRKLNLGEREAIALALRHKAVLLTNDRRAVRY
jgi:predicted nucleic acid-binding protein